MFRENEKYLLKVSQFIEPILVSGNGCYVSDADGKRYLDLNSGQFCLCLGHNHEEFRDLIDSQLKKIYHTNTQTLTPEVFLAAKDIANIMGDNLQKTIFLSTGSEANECALRYARHVTKKNIVVGMNKGYHGLTLASQALTMGGLGARPQQDEYNLSMDCEGNNPDDELEELIKKSNNSIAAVILEPIIGAGGMVYLDESFVQKIRRVCTQHDILLIFDECQTGFGRTGKWFAFQHFDFTPDIVVCAKSMGMGFAVSSVTFTSEVAEKIERNVHFFSQMKNDPLSCLESMGDFIPPHYCSHQNDPLSCVIVSFVIRTIKENGLLDKISSLGEYFLERLKHLSSKFPLVLNPRGLGLMLSFDFPLDVLIKFPSTPKDFLLELEKRGVLLQAIRKGLTFRLLPAYTITQNDIDFFVSQTEAALSAVCKQYDL